MSAEIIINGEKINLNEYFETLEIEKHPQLSQKKIFQIRVFGLFRIRRFIQCYFKRVPSGVGK